MSEAHDWAALKRLAEAATPGPWETDDREHDEPYLPIKVRPIARPRRTLCQFWQDDAPVHDYNAEQQANARYIAAAHPQAVLALLAAKERAEAERDELRGLLVTQEICADKARAEAAKMREAALSGLSALMAHEAYMTGNGYSGPDCDALHPRAAQNWRNVRQAVRTINEALAQEPGHE